MSEKTVLVVDDVEVLRVEIKNSLEDEGFKVYCATNGIEAIDILQKHHVDVLVTDIFMPDMDGIELCNQVQSQFPDLKIVAISGGSRTLSFGSTHSTQMILDIVEKMGASAVLKKPFSIDELLVHM